MSVLASKRKESKFEAITFSIDLHDMLLDFMQRSFGVKDLDHLVRVRYAYGKDETEDFAKYRYLMTNFKNRIDQLASQLTSNVRAANSTYPTSMRRKLKKLAIKVANGEIPYENIENMFRGWMGSFYKLLSRQQRKNLITLYEDLFDKTLSIVGKKLVIFDKEE